MIQIEFLQVRTMAITIVRSSRGGGGNGGAVAYLHAKFQQPRRASHSCSSDPSKWALQWWLGVPLAWPACRRKVPAVCQCADIPVLL